MCGVPKEFFSWADRCSVALISSLRRTKRRAQTYRWQLIWHVKVEPASFLFVCTTPLRWPLLYVETITVSLISRSLDLTFFYTYTYVYLEVLWRTSNLPKSWYTRKNWKVSSFVFSSSLSCFIVFKYVCILVRFVRCVYFKGCPFFDNDFPFFSVQKEVCGWYLYIDSLNAVSHYHLIAKTWCAPHCSWTMILNEIWFCWLRQLSWSHQRKTWIRVRPTGAEHLTHLT